MGNSCFDISGLTACGFWCAGTADYTTTSVVAFLQTYSAILEKLNVYPSAHV